MKVYELAKRLGRSSKEVLQAARYLEIFVKSHSSNLSDEEVKQIIKYFRKRRLLFFFKRYFSLFLLIFLITVLFFIINPQSVVSGEVNASVNELGELTLDWKFDDSIESGTLLIETDSELFLIEVFESGGNTIECCYDENLAVTLFLTDKNGNEEELETKNIEVSNNISTTSTSSTTTTTLAPTTTTTLAECNDEDFKPYTLYNSDGNGNTVMNCLNEQDALNLNYSYTVNPNPPPVSSPTTTTTSTTTTTLPSTINISTGETYITSCSYNSNPGGTRSYRKYFTNNGSQAIYLQHTSSMVAAQLINPGDTKTLGQYGATHGANSRLYKAAFTEAGLSDTEFITRNFNLDCQADIDITHSLASCAGSKGSRTRESSLSFTNNESETAYVNTRYSTNGGSSWSGISTVTVSAGATVNGPYYVVSNGGSIIWQSHRGFSSSSNVDFSDSDYYTQNTSNTIDCPDGYYVNVDGSNTYSLTLSCKKWNDNSKSSFRGNPWWGSQSTARSYMFALIALTGDYDDGDSDVEVTDYFNYPDSGNCFGIVNEAWFPWKRQNDAYVGWSFYAPEWNSSSTSSSWSSNDYENFVFAELVP